MMPDSAELSAAGAASAFAVGVKAAPSAEAASAGPPAIRMAKVERDKRTCRRCMAFP